MIGRKTSRTLAQAIKRAFAGLRHTGHQYVYDLRRNDLYDFLFDRDYEAWLLNSVKQITPHEGRYTIEFFMKLHTGESVNASEWTWEARRQLGQRILQDLAEDILVSAAGLERNANDPTFRALVERLQAELETDGYLWRTGRLLYSEAAVFDEGDDVGVLEGLMKETGAPNADVMTHHLELSEEHYVDGRWDDSISNSRKFLESVLQNVATKHHLQTIGSDLSPAIVNSPVKVRDYLESVQVLATKEKEAIAKIYGLLSETGGHPYIAAKEQSRLMRHLALTFSQFVLLRLKGFLPK